MNTTDPYNLNRFLGAQESHYRQALEEIRQGYKKSHWVWFIFPQMKGLGHSPMAEHYGIASLDEAQAYLANPVLKERLIEISTALLQHSEQYQTQHNSHTLLGEKQKPKTAKEILGNIDAKKVRSSMTLFDLVMPNAIFAEVLKAFYHSNRDRLTLKLLNI